MGVCAEVAVGPGAVTFVVRGFGKAITARVLAALLISGTAASAFAESTPEVVRAKAPGDDSEKPRSERAMEAPPPELAKANLKLVSGESLVYDIRVNGMPAGKASLEVQKQDTMEPNNAGPTVWIVTLNTKSNRAVSLYYDVRDRATAKIDTLGGFSRFCHIEKKDGDIKDEEVVNFDYDYMNMQATYERRRLGDGKFRSHTIPLKGNVLDPLTAIYYLRSIDFTKYKPKDYIDLPICTDRRVWSTRIKVLDNILVGDFGELKNRKYIKLLTDPPFKGLFEKKGSMVICVDIQTGIPLRLNVEIPIGSAEVELSEHVKSPLDAGESETKK
jgi:hypothetical protein